MCWVFIFKRRLVRAMLTLKGYTDNIGVLYLDCPHQRLEGEEEGSSNLPDHQQVHVLVGYIHAKVGSGFQVSEGVLCHKSPFSQSIFPNQYSQCMSQSNTSPACPIALLES